MDYTFEARKNALRIKAASYRRNKKSSLATLPIVFGSGLVGLNAGEALTKGKPYSKATGLAAGLGATMLSSKIIENEKKKTRNSI